MPPRAIRKNNIDGDPFSYTILNGDLIDEKESPIPVAFFDLDHTLIVPRSHSIVPKDEHDWRWKYPNVVSRLQTLYREGILIVIRTDQTKPERIRLVQHVIDDLTTSGVNVVAIIGIDKAFHKPETDLVEKIAFRNKTIDHTHSFMVGDAGGQKRDWSDRDLRFAERLGVKYIRPEHYFITSSASRALQTRDEVVVIVGIPGSGKSTMVRDQFRPAGYFVIDHTNSPSKGTSTLEKRIQLAEEAYRQGHRKFVFDFTNVRKELRQHFIQFARRHQLPARCIYLDVDVGLALKRNAHRGELGHGSVPDVAIYTLHKALELPTEDEGCEVLYLSDAIAGSSGVEEEPEVSVATPDISSLRSGLQAFRPMKYENLSDYPDEDVVGWVASSKKDGVRGIWIFDQFITRDHHVIRAPTSFTRWLPKGIALDGELWTREGEFNRISGIINKKVPSEDDWKEMKFVVFDLPLVEEPYDRRYPLLQSVAYQICKARPSERCPIRVAEQTIIRSKEHLREMFDREIQQGGEGLVIRHPKAFYEPRRTKKVMKLKPHLEDDAVVIGYEPGKGKFEGKLGALLLRWIARPDVEFKVGGGPGLDEKTRTEYKTLFPIGSIVKVQYMSLFPKTMKPRQPQVVGVRYD